MKRKYTKSIISLIVFLFLNSSLIFSQSVEINAGTNQIINWEKTHSAQLNGSVSNGMKVEWTCPQNSEVVFKDASNPVTEVTFPRPGYYLLILSDLGASKDSVNGSVIVKKKSHPIINVSFIM